MVKTIQKHIRKVRYFTTLVSVILTVIAIAALGMRGLNLGLDFTGGMVTEVKIDEQLTSQDLLSALQPKRGESTSVTRSGEDGRWVIRYAASEQSQALPSVADVLKSISHRVDVVSNSIVGAQVGQDLFEQGGLALLISVLTILAYLCFRFEWRLASGSLFALAHDVVLVLGFFAITQMEFNLTVFAAILAILGYSLNDSIIISDRIRELLIAKQSWKTEEINDQAVIATFSRTMVTSGTTLITVGALWMMGGAALAGFSTAMFIGVLSGTWSSISIGTVLPERLKLEPKHYLAVEVDTAP
ncbi:protein translocase subunit SecF [Vibrio sp. B1FLJ16]|uniref:protein translocase subunit SecF n=1 Tax=Vibrio sp. B1FLJ16 TaxID=2751178 RepID=UPI0015F64917|nr:protein translocase subunit SecF [Vibrio sp. B1FLJ16]CAD7817450.1 Part of the Sec protein translocase complex. Interacts with the SecYEG preprotein conducting channel. SecDF uses the proton motive force (PMF) to complete protein translocation after the ATP-dependent function of SecA [Vibrio sp. B1FLJ16]CAD7818529.1 Part of the Sec protein translocase complex. Interacts with the SecYEG preprotein conducting channel. SecDF uses the proton motive force (PMF) to complete protein translocation afte